MKTRSLLVADLSFASFGLAIERVGAEELDLSVGAPAPLAQRTHHAIDGVDLDGGDHEQGGRLVLDGAAFDGADELVGDPRAALFVRSVAHCSFSSTSLACWRVSGVINVTTHISSMTKSTGR